MAQVRIRPQVGSFDYPAGTALGQFRFRLHKDGLPAYTAYLDDPLPAEVVFDGVLAGDYVLTVTRLSTGGVPIGPAVTKNFTVAAPAPVVGGAPVDAVVTVA